MVLSHVCTECGHDLARVRARRDPHYGLSLVHCPGCAAVSVRRMHPAWRAWRSFLRVKTSLGVLVFQFAALVGFVAGGVGICEGWGHLIERSLDLRPGQRIEWELPLGFTVLFAVGLGMWLTAGFAHWRARILPWLIYVTLVVALLCLPFIVVPYIVVPYIQHLHEDAAAPTYLLAEYLLRLAVFGGIMFAAVMIGVWPGLWFERGIGVFRRWAWQARRRRLRGRRMLA